jgi:hypothetical protein
VKDIVLAEAGPGLWDASCRIHTLDPAVQIYEPATSSPKIAEKQRRHSASLLHMSTFKSTIITAPGVVVKVVSSVINAERGELVLQV